MRATIRSIKIRAPIRGLSGYSNHARALVRALTAKGIEVEVTLMPGWWIGPGTAPVEPWLGPLARPVDASLVLHLSMPHLPVPEPGLVNVLFTMFEAATIPPSWAEASARFDHVVVPTTSSRDAWIASGIPAERLHLSPLGVDPERYDGSAEPMDLTLPGGEPVAERRFRFLNVAEARPRKNQVGLVRAWTEATTPDDDAVLILRVGYSTEWDRTAFAMDVGGALARAGLSRQDAAPMLLLEESVPDASMPSLYTAATHYVSMSCGEGWDLPMLEAGASGLALVAPRHSAYLDWLDDDVAEWIPASRAPARLTGLLGVKDQEYFEGLEWWPPDEEAAVRVIREILDGRRPPRTDPERFRSRYSWERATERLVEVLEPLA